MVEAATPAAETKSRSSWEWTVYLPIIFIVGWWLYDLQFQWRALIEYQYGWIVVLLACYLIWERWSTIPLDDRPVSVWLCSLFVLIGTPFVLVAELYKQAIANTPAASFCLSVGCAFYLLANLLYLHGWKTVRHFLFPFALICLAVPLPGIIWNPVVLGLQRMVTFFNVETLNLLGIPALQQANVIRLPNCVVGVDEACSGVRSLQSSVMAGLFIGNLIFKRVGSQILFLIAGIGLALAGNFLRSFYLTITAHRHGIEALKSFHDTAGWSIFIFSAAGLIVMAWLVNKLEKFSLRAS
ncbi:MAG: exosortase/archaeosortase family protein [Verrucomicrobia bacterium]|nr:exosortase/archaeosortase family protein [Verrucomicrobiota bacterium]